jgi:phosphatidylglycerol:prolipoprotein diacylglycerol transferase
MNSIPPSTAYGWLMLASILVSLALWTRLARRDKRTVIIYIAALAGAFLGAKAAYLAAEGWLHWHRADRWIVLATGKSILGALLGGYAGVEIAKKLLAYENATGDWFAIVAPVALLLGRIGCVLHGCCPGQACQPAWFAVTDAAGVARWPAAQAEFAFNALALIAVLLLRRRQVLAGQYFHLYLIAYGLFRFVHEFWRDTPRVAGLFSGYHLLALMLLVLGGARFIQRRNQGTAP